MGLLEMLTDDEESMIYERVAHYATTNEGQSDMRNWSMPHILREWDYAKQHYLAQVFKAETGEPALILRKEVEFHKDVDELALELEDEVDYPKCFNDLLAMIDAASRLADDYHWKHDTDIEVTPSCLRSISADAAYAMRRTIYDMCSTTTLAANVYNGSTIEIPLPTGKSLKINHGCRVVKMLGKLVEAFGFDVKEFEEYLVHHSQILNQKRLKGTLCLSIHPLDYITMSDNDSGWESCMSWENQGCYRQGTVEMMNSECVVVAYLEAEKPMRISRDEYWNNKKWRELYVVHPYVITNVKGYPYCNSYLTSEVLNWLNSLIKKSGVFGENAYTNKIYHWGSDFDELFDETEVTLHFDTNRMYNDFGHNYHYCMIGSIVKPKQSIHVNYSGASECMICGELDPEFASDGDAINLACKRCDDYTYCSCCGEILCEGDDYTYINGEPICNCCFDDYYTYDMVEEESIHRDDAIKIYICNADHTEYCADWAMNVVTHRDIRPDRLTTNPDGFIVHARKWPFLHMEEKYFIEEGTWTSLFLDALGVNLCDSSEEAVVQKLAESDWAPM